MSGLRAVPHLRAVCPRSSVGHADCEGSVVAEIASKLIAKLTAPDGLATRAIPCAMLDCQQSQWLVHTAGGYTQTLVCPCCGLQHRMRAKALSKQSTLTATALSPSVQRAPRGSPVWIMNPLMTRWTMTPS